MSRLPYKVTSHIKNKEDLKMNKKRQSVDANPKMTDIKNIWKRF